MIFLIDTSYVMYYTIFSTFKKYSNEIDPWTDFSKLDPIIDNEYKNMLENKFNYILFGFIKKHDLQFKYENLYFCIDDSKKNLWRNELLSTYKISRKIKKSDFIMGGSFQYLYDVLKIYKEEYNAKMIKEFGCEGDDVIAILGKYFTSKNLETIIISVDSDLSQLEIPQYTLKNELITPYTVTKKYKFKNNIKWTGKRLVILKSLMGDSSDDIPGVRDRVGPKTAFKIMKDMNMIKEDENAMNNLYRNIKLIDLTKIPTKYKKRILCQIEEKQ